MCYQMKASRKQLNLSASEELKSRLEGLAKKFKRRSGSTVALEIVVDYIDFWEQAEIKKQEEKAALLRGVISNDKPPIDTGEFGKEKKAPLYAQLDIENEENKNAS